MSNFIIVDNFMADPDLYREEILKLNFDKNSTSYENRFPGIRPTELIDKRITDWQRKKFEEILGQPIIQWPTEHWYHGASNGTFELKFEGRTGGIHVDDSDWAGVLYLSPNVPKPSGTAIWRNKRTGSFTHEGNPDIQDFDEQVDHSKWDMVEVAENVYNRLILFKGSKLYHSSVVDAGFGFTKETARLTQIFFFNTENKTYLETALDHAMKLNEDLMKHGVIQNHPMQVN